MKGVANRKFEKWMQLQPLAEPYQRTGDAFLKEENRVDLFILQPGEILNFEKQPSVPRWKRGVDVTLALLSLPLWAPVMLLIAAVIKVVSPGPVIFRQERIGLNGRRFVCLKFRTMHANSGTELHQQHLRSLVESNRPLAKMDKRDFRLIPFARVLRSSGLDELPQIFNVLRGEMSFVGPRPCIPYEYSSYNGWRKKRFSCLPGLTGLWQVNGKNRTTFNQMASYDVQYSENVSFWLDLKIMLKTVPAILAQFR